MDEHTERVALDLLEDAQAIIVELKLDKAEMLKALKNLVARNRGRRTGNMPKLYEAEAIIKRED